MGDMRVRDDSPGVAPSERIDELYFDDIRDRSDFDAGTSEWHEIRTAPLFTSSVLAYTQDSSTDTTVQRLVQRSPFVSYGGIGRVISEHHADIKSLHNRSILYMNTNTPSSTIICGVQGSGKSHSVSLIIENSLISLSELGTLPQALSAVVFHMGAAQGGMHLPCESSFLGKPISTTADNFPIAVKVLVSPSNFLNMEKSYKDTGAEVIPLYLSTKDLNCTRMMSLMHISESEGIPLYMQVVQQILRSMGNKPFDYNLFKRSLQEKQDTDFTKGQNMPLALRLELLEAMLLECQSKKKVKKGLISLKKHFSPQTVTIVDLTDPFINASSASALFDIVLSLYLETEIPAGKLLVLDEAHKYLSNGISSPFVESIFSVIRQQRHLGIRTVISTQEPTVIPESMIGLCSTVVCHRFSSPLWWKHLKRLVAWDDESSKMDWFDRISRLRTGEGVVFCPLALMGIDDDNGNREDGTEELVRKLGRGCVVVKMRRKVTATVGESILSIKV